MGLWTESGTNNPRLMRIAIDFDYTLFNTQAMRDVFMHALQPFGVTAQSYSAAERELKVKQLYNVEQHLDMLVVGHQRERAEAAIDQILKRSAEFLYPDVERFLVDTPNKSIVILSYGDKEWQERKIINCGVAAHAAQIIAGSLRKEQIIGAWSASEQVIFLTDRGTEIDAVKHARPETFCIWVHREQTPYYDEPCDYADEERPNLLFNLIELLEE